MNLNRLKIQRLVDGLKRLSINTIADTASNWFKKKLMELNTTEGKKIKYGKLSGLERLKLISVNISAHLALFTVHQERSQQYSKKGPGRIHRQGVGKYVPRWPESRVLRGTVYPF